MFCPKCGKEIPNQAVFCPKCGATLAGKPSGTAPKKDVPPTGPASAIKEKIVKAAAANPKKGRRDKAGDIGKRKIFLIAAVVVIAVLILLPKSPSSDDPDRNSPANAGQGELGGTPAESTDGGVELGKDGKRSLKGASKDFKENYNYVFDHQNEVIALYYQAQQAERAEIANSFKGSLNALRDMVAAVDPKIFDMIALDAATDNADSFLGMHLIYSGVNAYFSDSELGRGLRDFSEGLILSAVMDSSENEADQIRKDELVLCAGSADYALMQTRGTLDEILRQIDVDSGYNTAMTALNWYSNELLENGSEDVQADVDAMWNGTKEEADAAEAKWEAIRGRMAAVDDCITGWKNSRYGWINRLLHDVGLDRDVTTFTVADARMRIYALFDKTGKQHGVFTALDLADLTILNDGSIVYREGPEKNANLVKRDLEGNVLVSYQDVDISGYNTSSSSSSNLVSSYFRMAVCGNILRRTTESDFEKGEYQVLELVRPDGSAEFICEAQRVENALPYYQPGTEHYGLGRPNNGWIDGARATSDVFSVEYRALDGGLWEMIVDMTTGKTYSESDYISQFGSSAEHAAYLNDQYFIRNQRSAYYALPDPFTIYDKADPATPVADLSDGGGATRVFYSEESGQYWVISQTGYYYALDDNFRRIVEPVKLPGNLWDFCPFGLILYQDSNTFGLYDGQLKLLRTFPADSVAGFMAGNINIFTGERPQLELAA